MFSKGSAPKHLTYKLTQPLLTVTKFNSDGSNLEVFNLALTWLSMVWITDRAKNTSKLFQVTRTQFLLQTTFHKGQWNSKFQFKEVALMFAVLVDQLNNTTQFLHAYPMSHNKCALRYRLHAMLQTHKLSFLGNNQLEVQRWQVTLSRFQTTSLETISVWLDHAQACSLTHSLAIFLTASFSNNLTVLLLAVKYGLRLLQVTTKAQKPLPLVMELPFQGAVLKP